MKKHWLWLTAMAVGGTLMLAGCVQRIISITSQPSGALVYLNDEEVGRTPISAPHLFYGVYDIRLEHEGQWLTKADAARLLDIEPETLEQWIDDGHVDSREADDGEQVLMTYRPLWTKRDTKAPWWEFPGPDLFAEMTNAKVEQKWHFDLEPIGRVDLDALANRARELADQLEPSGQDEAQDEAEASADTP